MGVCVGVTSPAWAGRSVDTSTHEEDNTMNETGREKDIFWVWQFNKQPNFNDFNDFNWLTIYGLVFFEKHAKFFRPSDGVFWLTIVSLSPTFIVCVAKILFTQYHCKFPYLEISSLKSYHRSNHNGFCSQFMRLNISKACCRKSRM